MYKSQITLVNEDKSYFRDFEQEYYKINNKVNNFLFFIKYFLINPKLFYKLFIKLK